MQKLFCLAIVLFVASCAQVVSPTGGKRDSKAPVVIKSTPENGFVNFSTNTFTLKFDEYFTVKNPSKEWLISPPMKSLPEYKISGKKLKITILDTLLPHTTYTINLGNSLADVNEGNILIGFSYIFSTGAYLDSLTMSGLIKNARTQLPEKNALVMLYDALDENGDSCVFKKLPKYCAFSNTSGSYTLNHLAPGSYRMIALKDLNANYLYDSGEELIGYTDSLVSPQKNNVQDISVFKAPESKNFIKNKFSNCKGCYTIVMNGESAFIDVVPLGNQPASKKMIKEVSQYHDTINLWLTNTNLDTLNLALKVDGEVTDTIFFAVNPKSTGKARNKVVKNNTQVKITPENGKTKDYNNMVMLEFNRPIVAINQDSIKLSYGKINVPFKLLPVDTVRRKYALQANLLSDSIYHLALYPGAFHDCLGFTHDSVLSKFTQPSPEQLGNLYLTVQCDSLKEYYAACHWIFELINDKSQTVFKQQINETSTLELLHITPGVYSARMIIDQNKNGRWDTGNYLKKQQAEPLMYKPQTINLRANWDLEEEWKVDVK